MATPLNVLIVEDVEQDALLLVRELRRGGFELTFQRVETADELRAALSGRSWDIVISDWCLPRFSAPQALELVRASGGDIPFIIVSGTVNEDIAVDAIHAGAQDFMAKGRIGRLLPAIERELRDVALRAEQKKLRDQLTLSDRMASMGTLAAGIAHEINNPLACVMANLELASKELADRSERLQLTEEFNDLREELEDARAAVERVRSIVKDLKVFSRSQEERPGPVDVRNVMESTLRMASNELRHRARVTRHYGQTPPVLATESRLGQVFLNLIVNAAQAIEEGHVTENEVRISTSYEEGGGVSVEISDTGSGMSPEVVRRLFTPFFTTKPVGIGTGLGLSICHRIVSDLGGTINVRSELGVGTSFQLLLPIAPTSVSVSSGDPVAAPLTTRRARILVVDDEPLITRVICRALSPFHEVIAVGQAKEALRMIEAGIRFDLIICDLIMPQMTGMELYSAIRALDANSAERMVFMTGGAFTPAAAAFLRSVQNVRIDKPFDTKRLRALVNELTG